MQSVQPPVPTTLPTPTHGATIAAPVGGVATASSRECPVHLGRRDVTTASSDISRAAKAPTEHTAPPSQEVRAERMITEATRGKDVNKGRSREHNYSHHGWNTGRGRDTCKCSRGHIEGRGNRQKQTRSSHDRGQNVFSAEYFERRQEQRCKLGRNRAFERNAADNDKKTRKNDNGKDKGAQEPKRSQGGANASLTAEALTPNEEG